MLYHYPLSWSSVQERSGKSPEHQNLGRTLLDNIGQPYGDTQQLEAGDEAGHISMTNAKHVCLNIILAGMFTNDPDCISKVTELPVEFSTDHTILSFDVCLGSGTTNTVSRNVYNYKLADFNKLRSILKEYSETTQISECDSIDTAWQMWSSHLRDAIDECVPKVKLKNASASPWIDGETRHLRNQKMSAWKKAKNTNTDSHWAKFRELRNTLKKVMSEKYDKFVTDMASTLRDNSKRVWPFFPW